MDMEQQNNYDLLIKILVIGQSGVGKTCIIKRFVNDKFEENHLATIAIDFQTKLFDLNEQTLKLQIWDTAGQEKFNTLTQSFFKNANGIVVCFSLTDQTSFEKVTSWMEQIANKAP